MEHNQPRATVAWRCNCNALTDVNVSTDRVVPTWSVERRVVAQHFTPEGAFCQMSGTEVSADSLAVYGVRNAPPVRAL